MDFNLFSYLSLKLLQELKIEFYVISENKLVVSYCTEVGFTCFLSGGFTRFSLCSEFTGKKTANPNSVYWQGYIFPMLLYQVKPPGLDRGKGNF